MFALLRQLPYLHNRKHVLSSFRCNYSRRARPIFSKVDFEDTTNERKGYGEKEICLLEDIDEQAPLPGKIGGIPLVFFYTTTIENLPTPIGDKWLEALPLHDEKCNSILTQFRFNVVEAALSITNKLELVAHQCPILIRRDFVNLFPSRDLNETLTLITMCMKTENDMSTWSEEGEKEREKLTKHFLISARAVTKFLGRSSYWADFIHPATGKPYLSPSADATMFETDVRYRNFGLQVDDLGCCRIISHPIWGTNFFVAAIFTNAPIDCFEVDCLTQKKLLPVLLNSKRKPF